MDEKKSLRWSVVAGAVTPLLTVAAGYGQAPTGSLTSPVGDTISMDATNFTQHSITENANHPVHFNDRDSSACLAIRV
jgi:hypothetical protein